MKQPVEQLLKNINRPEPDLSVNAANLRQIYMTAVKNYKKYNAKTIKGGWFYQGRAAATFFALGAMVIIGGGTVLAQAGKSKPGDILYSLDRTIERTRLALANSTHSKLDLKIGFADERLDELVSVEVDNRGQLNQAIEQTSNTLGELDNEFDNIKLSLELDTRADITSDQLMELTARLRELLSRYRDDFGRLSIELEGDELEIELEDINDIFENELDEEQNSIQDGFLVELRGRVNDDGTAINVLGHDISLSLSDISVELFAGRTVKVEGVLSGGSFSARELKFGLFKLQTENGRVEFRATDLIEQDGSGYFVEHDGVRVELTGLASDSNFASLVGRVAELRGLLDGGGAQLFRVKADDKDGGVKIELRDRALDDIDDDGGDSNRGSDDDDEAGSDLGDDDVPDNLAIEAEGTLVFSGGKYKVTDEGVAYTIQTSQNIGPWVGQKVKVKGELASIGSTTIVAEEIRLDD